MRARFAAILGVVLASVVALVTVGAGGEGDERRYRIVFDSAFGIVEGADFRVAGVTVGEISSFDLSEGFPVQAVVEAKVTEPGVSDFRADATCEVRPQSLIGEYYVNCEPGADAQMLPNDTVPVEQTTNTIPLDLVNNVLRRPYRERLGLILNSLGAGLAGRSDDVQEVLKRAHPGLRETTQTLEILGEQEEIIRRFVRDSDTVVAALAARDDDIIRFVREATNTAEITASRRDQLAQTFDRFPVFLEELGPTMARLRELARAQIPVLRELRSAAPDLNETLRRLEPFSERTRPALLTLGDLGRTGTRAVRQSRDEIAELRDVAQEAPELAKPLRQFLESIDDRDRSIEEDPRAAETAPPAPDKNADAAGKGFTGMEALLNYFFWQTLSINAFDQISHVLRFTIVENECSSYTTNPSPELIEKCASWLGPYQPGITDPDPTAGGRSASSKTRTTERDPDRRTPRRNVRGGEPEAVAPEGAPDPSRPRLVLPDGVQELIDRLGGAPAPETGGDGSDQVLDYLLGR